jgi:hypothetical protein
MHPLKQLQRLLNPPKSHQGKLIAQTDTSFVIATTKGSLSVNRSTNDATRYQVGDTVLLANGVVVGQRLSQSTVYVL